MAAPPLILAVEALCTGSPVPLADGMVSAIAKAPVSGPVRITWLGLEGDHQADPIHHGGHDKALHLYPLEHHGWWRERISDHPLLGQYGAFGENLSTRGATDDILCLGDRFVLGDAIIELSHGRQPCSKLNHRFARPDILATVIQSGRAGCYFRVIREGDVAAPASMNLIERPLPDWPIARVFDLLIAGGHRRDPAGVAALARMPVLAEAWRSRAVDFAR
jgi:MOSC domain-containing protein YiiM